MCSIVVWIPEVLKYNRVVPNFHIEYNPKHKTENIIPYRT